MKPFEITINNSAELIPPEQIALWNGAESLARLTVTETKIHVRFEPLPANPRGKVPLTKPGGIGTDNHGKLLFGKNIITWGNGQTLYIKGKGYLFVKALYETKGMQLEIVDLEGLVWKVDEKENVEMVALPTFRALLRRLSAKLKEAKFPYCLLPTRIANRNNAEITGARLCYS